MIWWIFLVALVTIAVVFVLIARAGRRLRTQHVLPEESTAAWLESADGKRYPIHPSEYFYLGNHPSSQVILATAKREYVLCIFYHRKRFAFQTPSGIPEVIINGEEQLAGYLFDGDVLTLAGESFTFRSKKT